MSQFEIVDPSKAMNLPPSMMQMMGIMGGLPQGGVRPFQPSRGPNLSNFFTAVPYGGGMQGMRLQPNVSFGNRERFAPQPQPMFNTSGTYQDYRDSFNASIFGPIGRPLTEEAFNQRFGGQPQPPQVSPQPITPMTPTFAPQPQPARVMTEDERRMVLTTANPFSSGPDAINPMMGNRFNQARMEAGMGGIASLAPRQPIMNPFGRMGGLANLIRQQIQQDQMRSSQPSNPSQFMQPLGTPQPATQRPSNQPFFSSGLASLGFGGGFGGLMPQG